VGKLKYDRHVPGIGQAGPPLGVGQAERPPTGRHAGACGWAPGAVRSPAPRGLGAQRGVPATARRRWSRALIGSRRAFGSGSGQALVPPA